LTATAGFKRLGIALLAVIAAGTGELVAASYLISADAVRSQVLSEIHSVTGLNPSLRGAATVSLFPTGSVSFADVVLGDGQRPALTAERLTARLRFFPLLIGRVEISDVALVRPIISIDVEPNGKSNWDGLIEALTRSQTKGPQRVAAFSEMRIDNGTVTIHSPSSKLDETLSGVEFSLAWPSISKSFGATGRFVWHDEPLDMTMMLADFPAALAGSRTGLKLRIAGNPIKAAFEGAISVQPTLKIEGTLAADTVSMRNALTWAGQRPLPGGGFGHFAIKAQANVMGGTGPAIYDGTVTQAQSGEVSGSVMLTAEQVAALKAGKIYLLLDSQKAPKGNLWGWFQPAHKTVGPNVPEYGHWYIPNILKDDNTARKKPQG
jgi:AsmA protein